MSVKTRTPAEPKTPSQTAGLGTAQGSVVTTRIALLVVVICLLAYGLVMLYSASSIYSYNTFGDYSAVFSKQVILVAIGIFIALIIALIPYYRYSLPLCIIALSVTIPLLGLVLLEGSDALGARRWIDLGFTTVQPSEFAKIALILVMAHLVDRCRENGYSKGLIVVMIVACLIPIGLIVVEPDLGTTIIAVIGILAVLWFGGVPFRVILAIILGLILLAVVAIVGTGFRLNRITAWLDPWSDPQVSGYQLLNSYYAFGGGGIFGVGLGLSRQKFNWLPQSENDFLFAIIGEELGLIGAVFVLLLFIAFVFLALRIARNAPTSLGAMIAGAAGVIIAAQAFLNMLCVVGALPTTGKPLPFFSAGGSSIITTMILVGLVFSVSLQSSEVRVQSFQREQFTMLDGGKQRSSEQGKPRSMLSRLPDPQTIFASRNLSRENQPSLSGRSSRSSQLNQPFQPSLSGWSSQPSRSNLSGRSSQPNRSSQPSQPSQPGKVIPISRGRAEKALREKKALEHKRPGAQIDQTPRKDLAPISMSSLRRNRVRKSAGGGKSA